MDVTDALRRIVMRHLVLIALCTLLPVLGYAAYKAAQPPTYTASVQLEVADRSATSAQQATAVADTAIAKVKSVDSVAQALRAAGVTADPAAFQSGDLSVTPVLTAPDIMIDVSYRDKQAAVNIAQALAQETGDYFYHQTVDGMQANIKTLSQQLAAAQQDLSAQNAKQSQLIPGAQNPYAPYISADLGTIQTLTKSISDENTQVADAYRPAVIDQARIVPVGALSRYQPYVLVLALGLILGVGIAAVIESASPSVVGSAGLAGLFGAPHLGYAIGRDGKAKGRITDLALAARLHAAARRVGADTVVVAGDVRCDIPDLAARLDALLGGAAGQQIQGTVQSAQPAAQSTARAGAQASAEQGAATDAAMGTAGEGSKELATRTGGGAPALFSERLSFGEDIPAVWVHPRVVPYDEQVLLLLSTAPVSVAVAVVGAPNGKRRNLLPAIELVETSGWEVLGTIVADVIRPARAAGATLS